MDIQAYIQKMKDFQGQGLNNYQFLNEWIFRFDLCH